MLSQSTVPLSGAYDLLMFDVDGVVMSGGAPLPNAIAGIAAARGCGAQVAFVTNNASRPPQALAALLTGFGLSATAQDVVTSAQAACALVVRTYGPGTAVALLGGQGLHEAARDAGLVIVEDWRGAAVLLSGYGPDVRWEQIRDAARLVRAGLPYVASNADSSMSTPEGLAPGHGAVVDLIRRFAEVEPTVAGKPSPPLLLETIERVGGERPLMVGDRFDTDIEGAVRVGVDSLLVMTGVTDLEGLVAAPAQVRPTYIGHDLTALNEPAAVPVLDAEGTARLGGWQARIDQGELSVVGAGGPHDFWRVTAACAWSWADRHGGPPSVTRLAEALPGTVGTER